MEMILFLVNVHQYNSTSSKTKKSYTVLAVEIVVVVVSNLSL